MCMVSCPFGAISDKSQVFQLARALTEGDEIVAEIAPAFYGQFGDNITPRNLKAALHELEMCIRDSILPAYRPPRMRCAG